MGREVYFWTKEKLQFIRDNLAMSDTELGNHFGRTKYCINEVRKKNDIYRQKSRLKNIPGQKQPAASPNNILMKVPVICDRLSIKIDSFLNQLQRL